jgi:hypothetical protein
MEAIGAVLVVIGIVLLITTYTGSTGQVVQAILA